MVFNMLIADLFENKSIYCDWSAGRIYGHSISASFFCKSKTMKYHIGMCHTRYSISDAMP